MVPTTPVSVSPYRLWAQAPRYAKDGTWIAARVELAHRTKSRAGKATAGGGQIDHARPDPPSATKEAGTAAGNLHHDGCGGHPGHHPASTRALGDTYQPWPAMG